MSNNRAARPAGLGQRRIWVAIVAVLVVAALASAAAAVIRGTASPESRQQADVGRSEQAIPSDAATPTSSPEPSPTSVVTTSAAPASSAPPGAGQPASAPKPRITSFSATANGLIVTVTFTLAAQADRGPFTCSVRRGGSAGTEQFPCDIGQVSRTYNYTFCCGSSIFVTATDRFGVRSDQWDSWVEFPRPDPPTYSNVRGWHDGSTVHIEFDVTAAPGDDPRCDVYIDRFPSSIDDPVDGPRHRQDGLPCEGTARVSFPGPSGTYHVQILVRSDSHWNPGPPGLPETVRL